MPPCNCHPPFPRPEPFSPLPRPGKIPDWGKWIRDRLAEKGALLVFPTRTTFPPAGSAPNLYLAEDTGVVYRWGGEGYAVLVDPSPDVETFPRRSAFPATGRTGEIYIDASTNLLYRWNGTGYVLLTSDLSGVESRLADVESKVPTQATAQNQLADKAFVNSSIATNTANFLGTYSYVTDLGFPQPSSAADVNNAAIATALGGLTFAQAPTNNDYVFVSINYTPTTDVDEFRRFKYKDTTGTWAYEYTLNNSSFTAAQWAAISSGITSGLVAKLWALPTAEALAAALAGKASTAYATLTERGPNQDGLSAWTIFREGVDVTAQVAAMPRWIENVGWFVDPVVVPGDLSSTDVVDAGQDALYLKWIGLHAGTDLVYTATRTALPGYQLGSQDDRPLASEAEAEALRTAVANKPIILDVAHHSRITVGDVEFEVVLYWNSGARDRFFMAAQRVGTWLTQSGEWQSSAEAYTHTWESGGVTYTATRAAGNYFTPVYINGVESSLNNIASRCAGQDLGTTAKAFYDTLNAYFATCDGDGNRISDTYARKASPGHAGNLAALDADGNPTDSRVKPSDKLDATSAAPAFSSDSTVQYAVGSHVTYNGKLYKCTTATTGGTWVAGSWTADTMTDPDAVLDITAQNQLRVVAKDGTILWAQGYDLASTSSATLACDAVNNFTFADGATSQAFALPTAPSGKAGDFGLDIDNSANASAVTMTLTGLDTTFSIVVPKGESLNDMLAIAAGELARFYITLSTFRLNNLPTWHIMKQIVENGGATV